MRTFRIDYRDQKRSSDTVEAEYFTLRDNEYRFEVGDPTTDGYKVMASIPRNVVNLIQAVNVDTEVHSN